MGGVRLRREWIRLLLLCVSLSLVAAIAGCGTGASLVSDPVKTMTALAVSPANASIAVGATQQFTATATYSDGSTVNVTATASWSAANKAVATVNSAGMATGVAAGSSTIAASLSGVSGTTILTVVVGAPTLKSIAVSPSATSIAVGATQQFTAIATYSDGSTSNVTATASWSAANTNTATVNSAGLATGVAAGSTAMTASMSGISGAAILTVTVAKPALKSIAVTPGTASIAVGATQQFTATATYGDGSTSNVSSTASWTAANTDVATISSSGLASPVASGSTTITASLNGVSAHAPLTVSIAPGTGVNIATWHVDNDRSGLNAGEQTLSPSNVSPQTFGKLFSYLVDGYVYGEPLLVSNVSIHGSVHNVLYVATEQDSVYAFDADNYGNGAPLWKVSLLQPGETPVTFGPIQPYQGVTSTPVIDLSTNTMYVVSTQTQASGSSTFRLNALDIATGAQKFGGPVTIAASVEGSSKQAVNGMVSLSTNSVQRAALLLADGNVYIGFGGYDSGWLLAYDAQSLAQTAVFNASPNLNGENKYGGAGGIWMGSGGPAADSAGYIYVTAGNGPWNVKEGSYGDSVLKFNAQLQLQDYFTPDDYQFMDCQDADLSAGGLLLIPGTLNALAGGKTGKLYLVNTANLGQEQAKDAGAAQTLWFESDLVDPYSASCTDNLGTHTADISSYESFGTPAYFNGAVYVGMTPTSPTVQAGVRQFTYSSGTLTPGDYTTPSVKENTRGTTPFISADGTTNGILWMIDEGQPLQTGTPTSATLRAYDADNLSDELYNSGVNPGDVPGYGIKFTSPIVANGKVYISTGHDPVTAKNPQGELDVYGLK